jgi:hypothetical protein
MEPNDLYELVADYGEFYGMALRRDSHLLRGVDLTENWLDIVEIIGEERAQDLSEGKTVPTHIELSYLTRWQAAQALQAENDAIVCGIWLCQPDADDVVFAIEG